MFTEKITELIKFIISWQTLAGFIIGISFTWFYNYLKYKDKNELATHEKKLKAYQSIKSILNETLGTLSSPESVKKTIATKLKVSVKDGLLVNKDDQIILNDILEAHSKYLAFGETILKTPYSNKEIINNYHNFIYRIIEKIDKTLASPRI